MSPLLEDGARTSNPIRDIAPPTRMPRRHAFSIFARASRLPHRQLPAIASHCVAAFAIIKAFARKCPLSCRFQRRAFHIARRSRPATLHYLGFEIAAARVRRTTMFTRQASRRRNIFARRRRRR